jgi:hypothetical protein
MMINKERLVKCVFYSTHRVPQSRIDGVVEVSVILAVGEKELLLTEEKLELDEEIEVGIKMEVLVPQLHPIAEPPTTLLGEDHEMAIPVRVDQIDRINRSHLIQVHQFDSQPELLRLKYEALQDDARRRRSHVALTKDPVNLVTKDRTGIPSMRFVAGFALGTDRNKPPNVDALIQFSLKRSRSQSQPRLIRLKLGILLDEESKLRITLDELAKLYHALLLELDGLLVSERFDHCKIVGRLLLRALFISGIPGNSFFFDYRKPARGRASKNGF